MITKRIIIILIIWGFSTLACGQVSNSSDSYRNLRIKVSYFGEFVMHPGFAAGIDYSIYQKQWFDLHWDSEMGAYIHKWNNNALFFQTTVGTRFISSRAIFVDINTGLGYMLTTPNGDVYSVDKIGELTTNNKPYQSHLKPLISLLLGWDGYKNRVIPLIVQAGIEAYWQSHFNHSMLPHAAFRVGIVSRLKKN